MFAVPASASAFEPTHRLKITVEYRYDWSISPERPDRCGRSGSGFFHANASTKSVRVLPEFNRTAGRFVIEVPYGKRAIRDMPPQRLLGTYEMANNAPFVGPEDKNCAAIESERSGCGGGKPLPKSAQAGGGTGSSDTPLRLKARANLDASLEHCEQVGGIGESDQLDFKPMIMKAPSSKQLRKSSVTVQGSQTVHPDLSIDGVGNAKATRTVRFVFTRL
jgi:hypothetical protein